MLTSSVIFLTIDFYYVCWVYQIRHKFPHYIADYISKALYGFGNTMVTALSANLRRPTSFFKRSKSNKGGAA